MKGLIVLALLVALAPGVLVGGRHSTVIQNRASPVWASAIAETVAEFAPYRQVRLSSHGEGCERRGKKGGRNVVVICDVAVPANALAYGSLSPRNGMIGLGPGDALSEAVRENVVCHEMMHVFTGIEDNYDSREDSCIWGRLPDLGAFDITLLTGGTP